MKASELRPGQFCREVIEQPPKLKVRSIEAEGMVIICEDEDGDFYPLTSGQEVEVVHGWDEPQSEPAQADYDPANCHCEKCRPVTFRDCRFPICPLCGNKRCPHCWDHAYKCTGSNEPNQTPEPVKPAPLQLREGAWYRRRDKFVVGPAVHDPNGNWPWRIGDFYYDHDGTFSPEPQSIDLIAEVPPPVSDDFKAKALAAMKRGSDRVLKGKHPDECEFGQEVCLNCGWDKGGDLPKSLVDFDANGDAVCPECGHNACYFDSRDEVPPPVEPLPRRTDTEGRDVTDLPGLWDESDTVQPAPITHWVEYVQPTSEANRE